MSEVVYDRHGVKRARYAVAAVFAVHGAVTGSFATRVPWIQDHAHVAAGWLGFALAFGAFGASCSMPLANWITHRFGSRTALRGLIAMWTMSLILPSLAPNLVTLCLAMFTYGASAGMADVAMNALGVEIERLLDKSIMSSLHGMWSAGALIGSAGGTLAAHLGSDARVHHLIAALILTALGVGACHWVLDIPGCRRGGPAPVHAAAEVRAAHRRGGLLRGVRGGASLDWSAVFLHDQLGTSAGLAAASTTGFMLTMAVARLVGDAVVNRFGSVRTVRAGGLLAVGGGLLIVLADNPALAMGGFALLGLGIAVVVPLCFAAAGRSGPNPSQAIAGVATITYTSGLIAPSLIGGVAQATSLVVSFCLVTVLAGGLAVFAGVLRAGDRDRPRVSPPSAAVSGPRS